MVFEIENGKTLGGVNFSQMGSTGKIAFIVAGSIMTVVALISLFGFVGAILRKRRFVKAYAWLSWIVFLINLAGAGFYFYAVFSGKNLFPGCKFQDPNDNNVERDCTIALPLWEKAVSVTLVILELFVALYIAVVIGRYVDQLEDEQYSHSEYKLAKPNNNSTYTPTYYPPTAQEQGLLHSTPQYPYSDGAHSFGHTNA